MTNRKYKYKNIFDIGGIKPISPEAVNGIANAGVTLTNKLMNPNGNSTGVGNALSTIGSAASAIPGVGGLIGTGVNLVGGLINTMFGSTINEEAVAQVESNIANQKNMGIGASTTSDFLNMAGDYKSLAHIETSDIGSDGWFSNKASNKAKELNRGIDEANRRAIMNFTNTANNVNANIIDNLLANYAAYGGPITMRYTEPMFPFGNQFKDGGGIHIKKKNRGKFTEYCGGKVTSECIARGKRSSSPTIRKRATFAANARKWHHADGGPLSDSQYYGIMERVANENHRTWGLNSLDEALVQALNDNTYDYRGYYNKYPDSRANADTHWTDEFKTVYHPTFSNESRYSGKKSKFNPEGLTGGHWDGDTFVPADWQRKRAEGGPLFTHGGIWSNGMTYVNNGGTHEENPFEGVPMGMAPDGQPNLVEEGEVIFNDYVFSNRLKVPKDVKKRYKIHGETYADAAKELGKESQERPNDPISNDTLEAMFSALTASQEEQRMKRESRKYAKGGKLGRKYDDGSLIQFYTPSEKFIRQLQGQGMLPTLNMPDVQKPFSMMTPAEKQEVFNATIETPSLLDERSDFQKWMDDNVKPIAITRSVTTNTTGSEPEDSTKGTNLSYLRYAPAVASGLATFSDVFSKPDYSAAETLASVPIQPFLTSFDPVGQYLSYKPFDRLFYINQLNANAGATRRAIRNTSGGNRAAAMASLLSANYNYGQSLGSLARQAEEYNQAQRERVATFNRATDMYNSEGSMKAQTFNAQARENAQRARLAQAEQVARLRMAAKEAYDTRRSSNLNNFINSLAGIGQEAATREMINSNPALYYKWLNDTVGYKGNGSTTNKNGGKLKKKRRFEYA